MNKLFFLDEEAFKYALVNGFIAWKYPIQYDIFHRNAEHDGMPIISFKEETHKYIDLEVYNYKATDYCPNLLGELRLYKVATMEGIAIPTIEFLTEREEELRVYENVHEKSNDGYLAFCHHEYEKIPKVDYIDVDYYVGVYCNINTIQIPKIDFNTVEKVIDLGIYYS